MEGKKTLKISLVTIICLLVILALVVALVVMYSYHNNEENNNNIIIEKEQDVVTDDLDNDEVEKLIKNYILTDFGPKNNMKSVEVNSYKEITLEEYFSKTPGGPRSEEEKNEFINDNPDLIYGYTTFTIELIDVDKLTMEGSKPDYQEVDGNHFMSEAVVTINKKTKEMKFHTQYGFGN